MSQHYIFSSESVTEGHPDKVADQISDSVLDACLKEDSKSRVACETLVTTGLVCVAGEITTNSYVDVQALVRNVVNDIGYNDSRMGFDSKSCGVIVTLDKQSPDISQGVTEGEGLFKELGAGDQGLMFGYASNETPELMPMPIALAHRLTKKLAEVRKSGLLKFLRPDGKSQVSVRYENGKPVSVDTVVISTQHSEDVTHEKLKEAVIEEVVKKVIPANLFNKSPLFLINPTGRFVVGGPQGDCGLTGRKIIVDSYGGMGRHGGGAFSGKDPTKVDRSACYMARHVAKNIVAAGLADKCEVQVAYAIGYPEPVSLMVETFGTGKVADEKIEAAVREVFSFKPANIISYLQLARPIYQKTSNYGHFGRNEPEFIWETTDAAAKLKAVIK
ncbi:methionine adenosyltransferase [bacterium]|nr:methionine adenosyltransferase [bacterium]